ncbi:MAG: UDP-glucose/GDP-mannose dehydrogenase family protein [Acidobacteria bacterium]|nr:UDP-glucose/GDP-mannose dehydrogenase family protein [Acidobacteriota bacterium]MCI0621737.1 UDP-glucose/GDP-mannose dehydrogenase family protein [Acidobacteriota bacterium]MCI0718375.1 UDP-glucose/GDP-mannose dehydrogenase family protein [Acidobacteriota bacterium]
MHVTVVGTGYVGLVSGAGLADFGLSVTCVDSDERKVQRLQDGQIPIYEIGLEEIFRRNVKNRRLTFSSDLKSAVEQSLVVFIAVGTPEGVNGEPDLSQVRSVASSLAKYMDDYKVIATKSTVPVGTGRKIRAWIEESLKKPMKFDVVSNPEFLREGSAIEDFMRPNRVVIGAESEQAAAIVKDIYRPLYLIETPFVMTNLETAELIKYASNAFLATKISFINEMANLCEKVGADIHDVSRGMGLDKRIGSKFLHPGPGFGGSCFPKDVAALCTMGRWFGNPMRIAESVLEVNQQQKARVVAMMEEGLAGLSNRTIGVWGLAFKPNTDDTRESPAINICHRLLEGKALIQVYDPVAMNNAKGELGEKGISYCADAYAAACGADGLLIGTEWNEFRNVDLQKVKSVMKTPILFDVRNIFDPAKLRTLGFRYFGMGR